MEGTRPHLLAQLRKEAFQLLLAKLARGQRQVDDPVSRLELGQVVGLRLAEVAVALAETQELLENVEHFGEALVVFEVF